jgi:hypothetical protein
LKDLFADTCKNITFLTLLLAGFVILTNIGLTVIPNHCDVNHQEICAPHDTLKYYADTFRVLYDNSPENLAVNNAIAVSPPKVVNTPLNVPLSFAESVTVTVLE